MKFPCSDDGKDPCTIARDMGLTTAGGAAKPRFWLWIHTAMAHAARDARDRNRSVAPLVPAQDALMLDNSSLSIEASVEQVLSWWQGRQPF